LHNFNYIQVKLQKFINKFYINELIKGILLFFSLGLLYFGITLFLEYFLWLKPTLRTFLFWVFIAVELLLLVRFIAIPILKLAGLTHGISQKEASKIIGNHFPEVKDKLLNMLQLQGSEKNTELSIASIEQKSKELQPIPFKRAIDFSKNKKYIKYALIPLTIWLLIYVTGNISILKDSFSRVVHYNTAYKPPAPFSFSILNNSLQIIEGEQFVLKVETIGNTMPEDVEIYFSTENYYLKNTDFGKFEYLFSNVKNPINFYLKANGVVSDNYQINPIPTPVITSVKMVLQYPKYTAKQNEVIQNTGNAIVPKGTKILWQIETHQTKKVTFNSKNKQPISFNQITDNHFNHSKQLLKSIDYTIATTNKKLKNYESLHFSIQVIPDAFPKIIVKSIIDSVAREPIQFIGQISDDYGVSKLQLVYYDTNKTKPAKKHQIDFQKATFSDFYYIFPEGILIEEGIEYQLYFEVFDNDAVNGSKKKASKIFTYYNKTEKERKEELLKEQKETLEQFSKTLIKSKNTTKEFEKFKKEIQNKPSINWNDSKEIKQFIKRQAQYQQIMERQTRQLEKNLLEQPKNKSLQEKKEDLQQRIKETQKLNKQNKQIEELEKLLEKLHKEELLNKLQEISKKSRQNHKSLERILELTRRFYVEQKANQIQENLKKLAEKQNKLSQKNSEENTSEKQKEINKEFEKIKEDFKELHKQNKDLNRPMKFSESKEETNSIVRDLEKALEKLQQQQSNNATKNQKNASKKMKQLSKQMETSLMRMGGEQIEENIDDLRIIVENLIEFSFQQEDLLNKFSDANNKHPEYPKNIRKQQVIKEYFEHIDDSLYMLSLRLVKMSSTIQKEVSDVHYYTDKALLNFTENYFNQGISNQQFVITAANNLANMLSNLLESLLNASSGLGKGKGNSSEFSLPDIIKKQGEIIEKTKKGIKPGKSKNTESGKENSEEMNAEIYKIYKQQAILRELLKELLGNKKGESKSNDSKNAIQQMEELEKELLEKGFTKKLLQKMQKLQYELLKLEEANIEQGKDAKRKAVSTIKTFEKRTIHKIKLKNQYFNQNEILNRQSLPLRKIYKEKVQEYFRSKQQ